MQSDNVSYSSVVTVAVSSFVVAVAVIAVVGLGLTRQIGSKAPLASITSIVNANVSTWCIAIGCGIIVVFAAVGGCGYFM